MSLVFLAFNYQICPIFDEGEDGKDSTLPPSRPRPDTSGTLCPKDRECLCFCPLVSLLLFLLLLLLVLLLLLFSFFCDRKTTLPLIGTHQFSETKKQADREIAHVVVILAAVRPLAAAPYQSRVRSVSHG